MAVEHDPFVDGFPTGIYNLHVQGIAQLARFDYQQVIPLITIESPSIITIKPPLIAMNRHHQSPSFIEGYSQDVTEVSGGHEGIKKIIQSWGANCTLKLETTMVTTMDPNDKFTKPHDIPMIFLWRFTNISWKFS